MFEQTQAPEAPTDAPYRSLPDHAAETDTRDIALNDVGVCDLRLPIQIEVAPGKLQGTIATFRVGVALPADSRGTHMSRMVEILEGRKTRLTLSSFGSTLSQLRRRLQAPSARLQMDFPVFLDKRAPVSGARSSLQINCSWLAHGTAGAEHIVRSIEVPVTSLCPCSKAVADYGAHNQRSMLRVAMEGAEESSIESIVSLLEGCASAPLYGVLKREDEKFVTEQAYENPRFVEDLVREVLLAVRTLPGLRTAQVEAENMESIHNHSAFARLSWTATEDPTDRSPFQPTESTSHAPKSSFGEWLRSARSAHGIGQAELATSLCLSPSFLSKVERGTKRLSLESLARLAEALGTDPVEVQLRAGVLPETLLRTIRRHPDGFRAWAQGVRETV